MEFMAIYVPMNMYFSFNSDLPVSEFLGASIGLIISYMSFKLSLYSICFEALIKRFYTIVQCFILD